MAFCPGCGTQVADGTAFCPSCGKGITTASTGAAAAAAPAPAPVAAASSSGLSDNIAGLLCYSPVGLIADIIFLVADPYKTNKFIRFHAFQSLFLCGAMFALSIGFMVINMVLGAIFFPLVAIAGVLEICIWLGSIALFIYMMIKAYGMQSPHLPIVGALAEKQV